MCVCVLAVKGSTFGLFWVQKSVFLRVKVRRWGLEFRALCGCVRVYGASGGWNPCEFGGFGRNTTVFLWLTDSAKRRVLELGYDFLGCFR